MRPRLDPVTLRWLADEKDRECDRRRRQAASHIVEVMRFRSENRMAEALNFHVKSEVEELIADNAEDEAARLRNLATRAERGR